MIKSPDYSFKLTIAGSQGVGKSSLLNRFCDGVFIDNYKTTIGVDFKFKQLIVDDCKCQLKIWDTAGQQRFRTLSTTYYRKSQCILIAFDLTFVQSFNDIKNYWYDEVKNNSEQSSLICFVGNKVDLQTQIDKQIIDNYCKQTEKSIYYLSAKNGNGLEEMFSQICRKLMIIANRKQSVIMKKQQQSMKLTIIKTNGSDEKNKQSSSCCGK